MRQIGRFGFPSQGDQGEAERWRPYIRWIALARRVLVVANTRIEGAWNAYIDAVPGENHDREWEEVKSHGAKLPEQVARSLFPDFEGVPYAH